MDKIFVQIASYRDPELVPTIKDCILKAKYPQRLTFGIVNQWGELKEIEFIHNELNLNNIKIINIPFKESKGVCWARYLGQQLYNDEDFYLQIDSHMRFTNNWDETLVNIWYGIKNEYAILTTYPSEWYPDKEETEWKKLPYIIHTHDIVGHNTKQMPSLHKDWERRIEPYPARHIAAGFLFAKGVFIKDVPYDPYIYFEGEESTLSIRAWTNGYDIYHPHIHILYHYYTRSNEPKHWSENPNWVELNSISTSRIKDIIFNKIKNNWGLGKKRTIEEWQEWSGIYYDKGILHPDLSDPNKLPPMNTEYKRYNKTLYFGNIYDIKDNTKFMSIILKNKKDIEVYRIDLLSSEYDLKNINSWTFDFEYHHPNDEPFILIVWPYSNDWDSYKKIIIEND